MERPPREEPRPPDILGYVLHTLLGRGAYGEVWLGENRTTRRQVAVKLLRSRASLDWSLLDSETEKLAFLAADRRVVQLLDVGRDSDPPFFVMEYVSRGSLASHVEERGPLPLARAVEIFEELALALKQIHGKGILHCDLKPSNVLLDDELRPRLADFGQSRMSEDRSPVRALGTMFFMAPEQADMAGVPDARWDVYALGAILHAMLTGHPPHRSEATLATIRAQPDLPARLASYREIVGRGQARPAIRGLDKPLAAILGRCLAAEPRERFSTAEEIVRALHARRRARSRRPLMWLGGVGPLLLLAVMVLFGVRGYRQATQRSADAIRRRAFESNEFAATFIARSLESEVRRYFDIVAEEARQPAFVEAFHAVLRLPELERLTADDPGLRGTRDAGRIEDFMKSGPRQRLDRQLQERLDWFLARARVDRAAPRFAGVFVVDAGGTVVSAVYDSPTIVTKSVGRYYAWRTYFHGGPVDLPRDTPRARIQPLGRPHLSAPFESSTTNTWRLGVSVPLLDEAGAFAGLLVYSVDAGDFEFLRVAERPVKDRFAVLVHASGGQDTGQILLHPALAQATSGDPQEGRREGPLPRVGRELLERMTHDWSLAYEDPLGDTPAGLAYRGTWIAAAHPLNLHPSDGLMVVVQERSDAVTRPVEELGRHLFVEGLLALLAIGATVSVLWLVALGRREARADAHDERPRAGAAHPPRALRDRSTISDTAGPG
jgi:hypothetical protein